MDFIFSFKLFSNTHNIPVKRQWVKFGIIAAVILFSTVIAFWGSPAIYSLVFVSLVGVGTVIALIRQPNLGFIFILIGGMFIPFTGPSGLNMAVFIVALMLGLWIMDMFIVQRYFTLIRSRLMIPIIMFLVISVVAFGMGQIPWFVFARQAPIPAQVGGFAVFIFSVGCMLLSAHLIKNLYWLKIIVWTFIGLSAIYIVGRTIDLSIIGRVYHFAFSTQSMFWTWLIALVCGQVIYNNKLSGRFRAMLVVLILATFYVAIFQAFDWKSGWVPPLIAILALIGFRYRKFVVFLIPIAVVIALYFAFKLILTDEYSWGTRTDAWRIILEISRVNPLFGMGFSNYYWYTPLFPIRGWNVSFNSHSQYIDLIAQTGYLGLIGFLWIFFEIGRLSFNLTNRLRNGFARAYASGVFAGVIATLFAAYLGDWVLPFVYNVGLPGFRASILPWMFMGGMIALEQIYIHTPQNLESGLS